MTDAILVSILTSIITTTAALILQRQKVREESRTEFMAEEVAKRLLSYEKYRKRSLSMIRSRLGGFTDDELRRILVRAGAVRFKRHDGIELWGLVSRNRDDVWKSKKNSHPENKRTHEHP